MSIDLNVRISDPGSSHLFIEMAAKLGMTGLAVPFKLDNPVTRTESGITLFRRTNLTGNSLSAVRKQLRQVRRHSIIIAIPFKNIKISNWAAGDPRVDILTFDYSSKENILRESTARLAAESGTALEIPILSLLKTKGLHRSRLVKLLREACKIALKEGMNVVLSSGSTRPIEMRSPIALQYIGLYLGMDTKYWKNSIFKIPHQIVEQNQKKIGPNHIASGIEIIGGENQD